MTGAQKETAVSPALRNSSQWAGETATINGVDYIMFDNRDFFQELEEEQSTQFAGLGRSGALIGKWLGFIAVVIVLAYTGYHGINATVVYRAGHLAGTVTGIIGIVVTEVVLFSLILKWHNRAITGTYQMIAALVTFAIGVTLAALATVTDSQINAGMALSQELQIYLLWILPASPIIMGLLNHVVDELAPEQLRSRKEAEETRKLQETLFTAHIARKRAELDAQKEIANATLNARASAAKQIASYYSSDEIQAAIRSSALASVPALLRAAGVDPAAIPDTNRNGRLDTSDIADYLSRNPEQAADLFRLARQQDDAAGVVNLVDMAGHANGVHNARPTQAGRG